MSEWIELNRKMWDERAVPHAASPGYRVERFVADPEFLSPVVRFDLPRLGDVAGLRGVHLQCHIGTDTLSLHRLGARMTGLDFSEAALEQARTLARRTGAELRFVCSEVYAAPEVLDRGEFDLVFTGVGALCWLPDIRRWAEVVAALLRPGGRLFLREGHPMLWAMEGDPEKGLSLDHSYFEPAEPTIFDEPGTYVPTEHEFVHTRFADWNHGLGEVVSAVLDAGMELTMLEEHDSVPWEAFPGLMREIDDDEWQLADRPRRLAHSYTLQAVRR